MNQPEAEAAARHRRPGRRRSLIRSAGLLLMACGLLVTVLAAGGWALFDHAAARQPAGQSTQAPAGGVSHRHGHPSLAVQAAGPVGRIHGSPGRATRGAVARPEWLVIPAIGVSTTLVKLGLTAQGDLQVPATAAVAGWYKGSPRPGETGSSIIAGHIDSQAGPGIFYRLHQLRRGQFIYVIRANHTVAVFEVTRLRSYAKSAFPRSVVYGAVPDAELRVITCGGTFDYATGSYLSNVVVYAVLIR